MYTVWRELYLFLKTELIKTTKILLPFNTQGEGFLKSCLTSHQYKLEVSKNINECNEEQPGSLKMPVAGTR